MKATFGLLLSFLCSPCLAAPPREALPLEAAEWPINYRLHLEGAAKVKFTEDFTLSLPGSGPHDIAVEHPAEGTPVLRVWRGGEPMRTPDFPDGPPAGRRPVVKGGSGWVQALERSDHAELVRGWNDRTLAEGAEIYRTLCIVCHGTKEQPGSLPTALRFAEAPFKNGADPFSMYLTLTRGFGQMVPQGQYTTAQKYAVIPELLT